MKKQSAGLLLYKKTDVGIEVLIGHPGGPFWAKKDKGVWSIPKGECIDGEELLVAAYREFTEEMGATPPKNGLIDLGSAKQPSGKVVYAWALEADFDTTQVKSNTVDIEWPPKSGHIQQIPEIDKACWCSLAVAMDKVVKGQVPLLENLAQKLGVAIEVGAIDSEPQTSLI